MENGLGQASSFVIIRFSKTSLESNTPLSSFVLKIDGMSDETIDILAQAITRKGKKNTDYCLRAG
jgi:hypothetical protein